MTSPRHALVTGASSGIGAAIAACLLREGWRVTGMSRTDPGRAAPGYTYLAVDLLDDAAVAAALTGARFDAPRMRRESCARRRSASSIMPPARRCGGCMWMSRSGSRICSRPRCRMAAASC